MNLALLVPVDGAARWLNNLPVTPPFELGQLGTAQWMLGELTHVLEDALDERPCRGRIIQGDVVSYRL
jgi:hypothetical protein